MKQHNSHEPDEIPEWLEAVVSGRPTDAEMAARRRDLSGRPLELQRLDEELALNALLDARPNSPRAATNFAALVLERIATEDRRSQPSRSHVGNHRGWYRWLIGRPAWALAAVAAVSLGIGWNTMHQRHRSQMVATVAAVALTTSAPGLSAESLEDYEVIRRLGAQAQPGDDALIAALVESPAP